MPGLRVVAEPIAAARLAFPEEFPDLPSIRGHHDGGAISAHLRGKSDAAASLIYRYIYDLRARVAYRGRVFMPDRLAEARHALQAKPAATTRRRGVLAAPLAAAGIVLAGAMLAACSSSSDSSFSIFAEPGKYQYYNCAQIAAEMKSRSAREQELKALMDRADQSVGGAAVGFIAYKAEYVAIGEELGMLQSTARSKNCEQDQTWRSSTIIR